MKRCPECLRDYYDDSLAYCLDDGMVLVDGPSTASEAPTEILSAEKANAQTEVFAKPNVRARWRIGAGRGSRMYVMPIGIMVGVFLALGGYYYFNRSRATHISSIAVLPFVNQNSDPDTEYLADGIPESISNALSQLSDLKVMSRNSVSHYKGSDVDAQSIARELMQGTIARSGASNTAENFRTFLPCRTTSRRRSLKNYS
jgi:hypothetical protein